MLASGGAEETAPSSRSCGSRRAARRLGPARPQGGPDTLPFEARLADVAKAVAEASSEGGFLDFGGVQASDADTATLAQIAAALGALPSAGFASSPIAA